MKTSLKNITINELKNIIENTVNILINERHVLKMPKKDIPMPQPMPPQPSMPPVDNSSPMPSDQDQMTDDLNGMDGEGSSDRDELRKEVGNVAHLLQSDEIEAEDAKSALNTVIQQAKKKMDGSDLKKSADKLTNVDDASEKSDGNGEVESDENEPMPNMESRIYLKNRINEIFNGFLDDEDKQYDRKNQKKITNRRGYKNPFISKF